MVVGWQFGVGDEKFHDYEDSQPEKIELGFQFEEAFLIQHLPQHTFQNEIEHLHFLQVLDAIVLEQLQVFLAHKNSVSVALTFSWFKPQLSRADGPGLVAAWAG